MISSIIVPDYLDASNVCIVKVISDHAKDCHAVPCYPYKSSSPFSNPVFHSAYAWLHARSCQVAEVATCCCVVYLVCTGKRSTLDGELAGPFSSRGFVSCSVGLVDMSDLGNKWIVGVWVCEHRADGEEDYA